MKLQFIEVLVSDPEVVPLLNELSVRLNQITGSSGEESFASGDVVTPRSVFILVRQDGNAVACGGLRKVDANTCEIKRMYSSFSGSGIGGMLLHELELRARAFGYSKIILETRKVNSAAVSFYLKNGYVVIENYGKYVANDLAVCFGKSVSVSEHVL